MRPSVHGDVVHSRPVAINFGTDAAPRSWCSTAAMTVCCAPSTATGHSRIGSVAAGDELWSFMPPEFYTHQAAARQHVASQTPASAGTPKTYGIDGPMTAYKTATGDVWIFATMRRGGRVLYAFKVNGATRAIP